MNKKIAIFFSGRITSYEHTFSHLQKIIDTYQPIFFASLNLESQNDYIQPFCNKFNIQNDQLNIEKTILPPILIDIDSHSNVLNTYSMFYHNYKAFQLVENYQSKYNIHFDVVVKYRAEVHSSTLLDFSNIEKNKLYIPADKDYGGINDQIAYGDFDIMQKYSQLGNGNIEKLHLEKKIRYHPETLLKHHLDSYKMSIIRPKFSYDLHHERRK